LFSFIRELVSVFAFFMAVGVYVLMGLTPMVPKRLFLPIPLFTLATILAVFPIVIYCYGQLQQFAVGLSVCQVILGLALLRWSQGSFKFRWPLVPENRLGGRRFSWVNLSVFGLATIFVLIPAVLIYLLLCATLAVNHFSQGFMALHPGGFTVEVRKYVRNDGKMIELFPMSHVADAGFYQQVSQTFPSNSIHCHPVERGNKRLNDLKTMRILCFGDVSDMNFVCDFSAAATVPNCRNARRKNDFCSSHRVDSSRTISPLRPTLPRQPLDS
jgi:hypothetical protein